jgi:hypothetical protein
MSERKPRRGRPKGTGINDRDRLNDIERMIAVNPRLKPTTAIKALGISNPSTIRRLRDKYKVAQVRSESGPRRPHHARPASAITSRPYSAS